MAHVVHNTLIVAKAGEPQARTLAEEIAAWMTARGVRADVAEHLVASGASGLPADGRDLVLVLGGDGTLISVGREVAGRAPLLGLNMGRFGFLTELSLDDWREPLERLLAEGVSWRERMGLAYEVHRRGVAIARGGVVNDVVVNRGSLARLVRMSLHFGGELLGSVRADGLVVATPTGSTGYSISSGGPIVHPGLDVFTVTPICPFLSNFKPVVLPGDVELCIRIEESGAEVYLTLDGQDFVSLEVGDEIRAFRAERGMKLVDAGVSSYVTRLRAKGVID